MPISARRIREKERLGLIGASVAIRVASIKRAHDGAMAMGDLVLLESEINPVMLKMIAGGLQITAIHNHLLRANPATFYMHVAGHGDPAKLATVLRDALAESKTPLQVTPSSNPPSAVDLDTAQLDQIIGAKGKANGGVYQFNVPRRDPVSEGGMQLTPPGPMGMAIGINFQPTGDGKAAITGDFGSSSCIFGPMTMQSSSPRDCGQHSTRPQLRKTKTIAC